MLKKILWTLLGIIIVVPIVAGLAGAKIWQFKAMGADAAAQVVPPETVNSYVVHEQEWQPRISSVGSVMAVQGTVVSTEAAGVVRQINFDAGSDVKKGDMLVQLDSDIEQAQLRDAQAAADLARVSFARARDLVASKSIAQAEYDTSAATLKQALAKIENIRAVIDKKSVRAPFSGKLGIRQISVGQYLEQGSPVVSLQALDPVYVDFSLPQQRLGETTEGLTIAVTTDAYPGQMFEGKITAINPDIDPATRSVRLQGTLKNSDHRLRPGMFVSIDLIASYKKKVLFIPETAVQHASFGDFVFVIDKNTTAAQGKVAAGETTAALVVRQQLVRLDARQGDFVVAAQGVKAGDKIVSTGVFKLRPGTGVVIDNSLAPEFKLEPKPGNT
jgi:membrane fusion protein (multidrug efflux system)